MKKIFTLGLIATSIFALTNCTKEMDTPSVDKSFSIIANPVETKTTLDGMATKWASGDAINVVYAPAGSTTSGFQNCEKFTVSDVETGNFQGTYAGTLTEGTSYDWYALYPYASKFVSPNNASTCYTTLGGTTQTQAGNSNMDHLAGYKLPLYGYAAGLTYDGSVPVIPMNPLCGAIRIRVTNTETEPITVSSIKFSNENEQIAGTFYVSFVGGNLSLASSGENNYTKKYVILNVTDGAAIAAGESADFYIAVKPFMVEQGDSMEIEITTTDDAVCTKTSSVADDLTFSAGKIKTLKVGFEVTNAVTYSTVDEVIAATSSLAVGTTSTDSYNIKDATVMAVNGKNAILNDGGSNNIVYYGSANLTVAKGDVVDVTGKVKNYNGTLEFASDQTITKTGTTTPSYPTPAAFGATELDAYSSAISAKYVTVQGTVNSTGYMTVSGTTNQVRLLEYAGYTGATVKENGYVYSWHSTSNYAYFIPVEVVGSLKTDVTALDFAAAGSSKNVVVTTDKTGWTVDASAVPSWLTVAVDSEDATKLVVTAAANTGEARNATISIAHADAGLTCSVAVSQVAASTEPAATWTRVTAISDLTAGGTFIMGYEATANSGVIVPMQNAGTATTSAAGYMYSGSTSGSSTSATLDMSDIVSSDLYEVEIAASTVVTGAIVIKVGENYIGNTDTKNNLKLFTAESENTAFTPTIAANDVITLKIAANSTYTTLQYNTGSPRFAVYGGTQKNFVIYKKD